jgi:hypothetical protein
MTLLIAIMLIVGLDLSWHWLWAVIPLWICHLMWHQDVRNDDWICRYRHASQVESMAASLKRMKG